MNLLKLKQIFASFIFGALCMQMFAFGINGQGSRSGQSENSSNAERETPAARYKIAPDLEEKTNGLTAG